ncbi:MAG: C10 family peptidase, partial [Bacteroidales bacterium]|nr:C10 family peptidase [Candidatus Colimorpha onthohippi]
MQKMVFYKLSSFANRQAQKTTVAKQQTNLFVFLLFLLIASFSYAGPIDSKMALQVAQSFMNQKVPNADKLIWLDPIHPAGYDQLWLFNCLPQGFVLVAADDAVRPILAYSTDGQFQDKEMPAHIQSWIAGYAAEIRYLQSQHITAGSEASREWDALVDDDPFPSYTAQSVAPMLTTKWNQSPYYNSLCPYSSRAHSRAVTGCVATAMSQIMRYWSHPNHGVGSHSYYCRDFGTQSADFENTVYQWDMMPNMLTSSSTQAQMEAVATLMYHCGVAVEMGYGVDASGAYTYSSSRYYPSVNWALIDYFDYSTDIQGHSKSEYTNSGWIQMLQTELLALRPILYSGSDENGGGGHAFVCDGFNTSNQFHFNWGWGGSCDGYYVVGQLNPGGNGIGGNSTYTFNIDNEAITHIIPNSSQPGYRVSATVSDNNRGSVSGAGIYLEGDTVALLATAQQGYRFVEWTMDDQSFQNNPFLFIVEDNYNFEARFATIGSDTIQYD